MTLLLSILRLAAVAALDIAGAVCLAKLVKKERFCSRPRWLQQIAVGVVMGALAVAATELGTKIDGASINLRDAAPLIAGLFFGGPSGILAGIIGGAERWMAASWGAGEYTKLACSLAAPAAGLLAAGLRRWFFLGRRPRWTYALLIGAAAEVVHMLLIFLTNIDDLDNAFIYVEDCAPLMILGTALCTAGAAAAVRYAGGRKEKPSRRTLENILQRELAGGLLIFFFVTVGLSWVVLSNLNAEDTASMLLTQLYDVPEELNAALENALTEHAVWVAGAFSGEKDKTAFLLKLVSDDTAAEAYVVNAEGTILLSADAGMAGRNIAGRRAFSPYLRADAQGITGSLMESLVSPEVYLRYSAVELPDGLRLLLGNSTAFVSEQMKREIALGVAHWHVGTDGYLVLANADGIIVSSEKGVGKSLAQMGLDLNGPPLTMLTGEAYGVPSQYVYAKMGTVAGQYTGIALIPEAEAKRNTQIALYLTIFIEILIFTDLFFHLAALVRRRVVRELQRINATLGCITAGDLEQVADVRSSAEFEELSDDINATVDALKRLIAQEAARMDAELEMARVIQRTSLPSVLPPYDGRAEFEISALMEAAKEVGGDFYDFFLLGEEKLAFLIADVSGKGIPAAMFMMRAKTQLKSLAESGLPLDEVFRRANDALCENNKAGMFVTVWMGIVDLATGEVTYVNAGHNPVIRREADGEAAYLRSAAGFVLGGLEGFPYTADTVQLAPGDTLLLYTDGITEAQNKNQEQFGEEALLENVRMDASGAPADLCEAIRESVTAFTGDAEQFDDFTLLAVRYRGPAQ